MTTRTACEVLGALLILAGLYLAWPPLALIALGLAILYLCYLTEGSANP